MVLGDDGIPLDPKKPANEQCPAGTWICMTTSSRKLGKYSAPLKHVSTIPIAGNIHIPTKDRASKSIKTSVNSTANYVPYESDTGEQRYVLTVTLNGGFREKHPARALIRFICNQTVEEPSFPVPTSFLDLPEGFAPNDNTQQYTFVWKTKHACPLTRPISTNLPHITATRSAEPSSTGSPLVDTESTPSRARIFWIIGTLFVLLTVIYGFYLVYQRRAGYSLLENMPDRKLPQFGNGKMPFPQFSRATIIKYLKKPFRRRGMKLGSQYHPLFAEEYEIPDIEDNSTREEVIIVDFQSQSIKILGKNKNIRGHVGYGTVR